MSQEQVDKIENRNNEKTLVTYENYECNDDEGKPFRPWEEAKSQLAKFENNGHFGHLEAARNNFSILLKKFQQKVEIDPEKY